MQIDQAAEQPLPVGNAVGRAIRGLVQDALDILGDLDFQPLDGLEGPERELDVLLGEEHRLTARQRLRPPLPRRAWAEGAKHRRRATGRRDAHQRRDECPRPREDNRVVVGPRTAEVL